MFAARWLHFLPLSRCGGLCSEGERPTQTQGSDGRSGVPWEVTPCGNMSNEGSTGPGCSLGWCVGPAGTRHARSLWPQRPHALTRVSDQAGWRRPWASAWVEGCEAWREVCLGAA